MIIAAELRTPLRVTSGPAIQHAGDLAAILSVAERGRGAVPRRDPPDGAARRGDALHGDGGLPGRRRSSARGPGATAIPLEIPPFTLVGATTRAGLLPGPLRDRFGFTAHLDFYAAAELELILRRSAGLLGVDAHRRRRRRDRRRGRAARPASPTGCCAGCATSPRCAADGVVDARRRAPGARPLRGGRAGPRPARPRRARRAVPPLRRRAGRARRRWRSPWARSAETVEEVAEPFLVRCRAAGPHPARAGSPRRPPGQHLGLAVPAPRRSAVPRAPTRPVRRRRVTQP